MSAKFNSPIELVIGMHTLAIIPSGPTSGPALYKRLECRLLFEGRIGFSNCRPAANADEVIIGLMMMAKGSAERLYQEYRQNGNGKNSISVFHQVMLINGRVPFEANESVEDAPLESHFVDFFRQKFLESVADQPYYVRLAA